MDPLAGFAYRVHDQPCQGLLLALAFGFSGFRKLMCIVLTSDDSRKPVHRVAGAAVHALRRSRGDRYRGQGRKRASLSGCWAERRHAVTARGV